MRHSKTPNSVKSIQFFFNLIQCYLLRFLRHNLAPYLRTQVSMTRGAQRERERARAEARNKKHEKKGAGGNAQERRERDAAAMREKQAKADARKAGS